MVLIYEAWLSSIATWGIFFSYFSSHLIYLNSLFPTRVVCRRVCMCAHVCELLLKNEKSSLKLLCNPCCQNSLRLLFQFYIQHPELQHATASHSRSPTFSHISFGHLGIQGFISHSFSKHLHLATVNND